MNRFEFFDCIPPVPQADRQRVQWMYLICKWAHDGQYRDGGERYVNHVIRVATILIQHGYTDVAYIMLALGHDLLEDTFFPLSLLEHIFGPDLARGIVSISKSYGFEDPLTGHIHRVERFPGLTKAEKLQEYFAGIERFGRRAAIAKCADRIDNLTDLVGDQPEGSRWTPEKRLSTVEETREWVLPLADRYEPRFAATLRHQCDLIEANATRAKAQAEANAAKPD